jgi:predicted ribosome quality control (RQC) complex YloA/Tae2 family protein
MHLNYHFFKFLCPSLDEALQGYTLVSCFTQNKDELILEFQKEDTYKYIRAHLSPSNTALSFPDKFSRSKKNNVSLFEELEGKGVEKIEVFENERAFTLDFQSGERLVFKMHGTRSNILLYKNADNLPTSIFRNELKEDMQLPFDSLHRPMDFSRERFDALKGNASQFIPTLGKTPREWLKEKGYINAGLEEKWDLIQDLLDMLASPIFSIAKKAGEYRLTLLPEPEPIFQSSSPIAASNEFFRYAVVYGSFEKEKEQLLKSLEDKLKKTNSYISKTWEKLEKLQTETSPQQLADIVMANLHQMDRNKEEHVLFDFYQDKEITVKIKRGTTPQKYAENLYRKGKNRKIEIAQLEENLGNKENHAIELTEHIEQVRSIENYRDLKSFQKEKSLTTSKAAVQETVPYKRFEIDGFVILVGKSAKSNDEMLRYHAWKDDIWLHAKGVAGSHVIIKSKGKQAVPKTVLEKAAEMAAYYSKSKTDSLAPVIYTPCKFVRKVKGSAPGSVMVDKESVLLVKPQSPQELT